MSDEIISCSTIMMKVADFSSFNNEKNIYNVWKSVVSKIKNYNDSDDNQRKMPIGERLAGNTRAVEYKKGVVLVEVDHSGWIQYLRMYEKFIIKGLQMNFPDLQFRSLVFRLSGTSIGLNDNYEEEVVKARQKMSEEMDKQDEKIEKFYAKEGLSKQKSPGSNLPPELLEKFESIKRSMLTNSEK